MQEAFQGGHASKRRRLSPPETGPYVLRKFLEDIPLRGDAGPEDVRITCIEYWNSNLYIGTSASEILHFFLLPTDSSGADAAPTFIIASRLQPSGHANNPPAGQTPGVRQILVLPGPAKACVLCNGVVSFYSLPELSPAFPNKEPTGVSWIGGLDEDHDRDAVEDPVVMIASSKRILLVKVGEKLRPLKNNIEYASCLKSSRRGTIACVADKSSYALLEIEQQQKIPLFSISSVEDPPDIVSNDLGLHNLQDSSSYRPDRAANNSPAHGRSTSLGDLLTRGIEQARSASPATLRLQQPSEKSRTPSPSKQAAGKSADDETSASRPRASTLTGPPATKRPLPCKPVLYEPHILSPSSNDFLLTTGSGQDQPGVGIFVNLDGDVVRGTVEFERYPMALAIDKASLHDQNSPLRTQEADDILLALIEKPVGSEKESGVESQSLSQDPSIAAKSKAWLALNGPSHDHSAGLHGALSTFDHNFKEVGELLRLVRLRRPGQSPVSSTPPEPDLRTKSSVQHLEEEMALFEAQNSDAGSEDVAPEWETRRTAEETKFAASLGFARTQVLVWSQDSIWQVQRNPEVLKLETSLVPPEVKTVPDVAHVLEVFRRIRDREPQSEAEFLSLNYVKQKASLMIFLDLLKRLGDDTIDESNLRGAENILLEGGLDPRVILLLIPPLENEVRQGQQGLWIHQGLANLAKTASPNGSRLDDFSVDFWLLIRRYLTAWQGKRGYGSITDEQLVFDSIDSALLHVLLHLDTALPSGSGAQASTRIELNNVVDRWKGDFNSAVSLLEKYHRLFVLSRLYGGRKQSKYVLATWKRIVNGEKDLGAEKTQAEIELQTRRYLVNIRDAKLVEEYSLWLATLNSTLAIQFFTDDASKVRFSPQQITSMLKSHAPSAVQEYLEHLVFQKNLDQYADDLIGYYLDSVLNVLEHSDAARSSLTHSYSTYRALESPKPTYMGFITANAPQEPWWQSRLRLLQLLGSGSYASSATSTKELTYSIAMVLERLAPYSQYLVSESIILDARRGRHKEALKLLTHGLGDYDTAVRYCYFGGPAPTGNTTIDASALPPRSAQSELFTYLFTQFLVISNAEDRIERTSHLLGTFATFFDPLSIMNQVPSDWSVHMLSEFILRTLRAATTERNQVVIMKALSAAQNLQEQVAFVDVCEKLGATIIGGGDGDGDMLDGPGPAEVTGEEGRDAAAHML